jgi:hypothetical protein
MPKRKPRPRWEPPVRKDAERIWQEIKEKQLCKDIDRWSSLVVISPTSNWKHQRKERKLINLFLPNYWQNKYFSSILYHILNACN